MKIQLVTTMQVHRERFAMEHFIGSDDIFALVKEGVFSVLMNEMRGAVLGCVALLSMDVRHYFRMMTLVPGGASFHSLAAAASGRLTQPWLPSVR